MSKLEEKIAERDEVRSRLLASRIELEQKKSTRYALDQSIEASTASITRDTRNLVALTREVGQLLEADLAGVVGKAAKVDASELAPEALAAPA